MAEGVPVYVSVLGRTWFPGSVLFQGKDEKEARAFAFFMAKMMRDELRRVIDSQRYLRNWPPLSISYLRYKKEHHLSLRIWEATGFLKENIVAYPRRDRFVVGFRPGARHPSGVSVLTIARVLEYGSSRVPARPLFRPLLAYMRRHVRQYYKAFEVWKRSSEGRKFLEH